MEVVPHRRSPVEGWSIDAQSQGGTLAFSVDQRDVESKLVSVQYLHHVAEIGHARVIVEKPGRDFV